MKNNHHGGRQTAASPATPEDWHLFQGTINRHPALVRINRGVKNLIGNPDYGYHVDVSIPFGRTNPDGLPSSEENEVLSTVEEIYVEELESHTPSIFVAAVTSGGVRQLMFYTGDPLHVERHVKKLREKLQSYRTGVEIREDSNWDAYRSIGV